VDDDVRPWLEEIENARKEHIGDRSFNEAVEGP
jgi:hypothetical protein